jgi:hypothetical protein
MTKDKPVKKETTAEIVYEPIQANGVALAMALEIIATAANLFGSSWSDADLPVIA